MAWIGLDDDDPERLHAQGVARDPVGGGAVNISIGNDLALAFGLLFVRAASMTMALPQMLGIALPASVKLLLAILLAGALLPLAKLSAPLAGGLVAVAVMALREVAVGVILSFAAAVVVGAVTIVGELVGTGMELTSGAILRGTVEMPNLLGDALGTMAGLLFFVGGFHRALLLGLGRSLAAAPLGALGLPDLTSIVGLGGRVFAIALEIGLPLMIPLFILALTQGVISRIAPQINILIAAPAAVILAGLVLLGMDSLGLEQGILHAWSSVVTQSLGWLNG
jgi:flagellar biosynthesis protein FliR